MNWPDFHNGFAFILIYMLGLACRRHIFMFADQKVGYGVVGLLCKKPAYKSEIHECNERLDGNCWTKGGQMRLY